MVSLISSSVNPHAFNTYDGLELEHAEPVLAANISAAFFKNNWLLYPFILTLISPGTFFSKLLFLITFSPKIYFIFFTNCFSYFCNIFILFSKLFLAISAAFPIPTI